MPRAFNLSAAIPCDEWAVRPHNYTLAKARYEAMMVNIVRFAIRFANAVMLLQLGLLLLPKLIQTILLAKDLPVQIQVPIRVLPAHRN